VIICFLMKRVLEICFALIILVGGPLQAEIYLWPQPGLRSLSSTFCEYREGHFHAGIDIRSFGKRGLPCFAIGDGYVSRVKIRPGGYGKALYLKLDDGITAVYAHLYGFSAELDSVAHHTMLSGRGCWCDIFLPEGEFRFETGDTLAYAGRTGTVSPHLHFELRDAGEKPFNPLTGTYTAPDRQPPFISGLEIIPVEKAGTVDGSYLPRTVLFRAAGGNSFSIENTLQLDGAFGFGISAWDEQKLGGYKMGPYSIRLFVDGSPLYVLENDSFSYDQSGQVRYEYNIYGEGWPERFRTLYRLEGNTVPGRKGPGKVSAGGPADDAAGLTPGVHEGEVLVSDAAGNSSWGRFYFSLHKAPRPGNPRRLEDNFQAVVSGYDPDGGQVRERVLESADGGDSWKEARLERFGDYRLAYLSPIDTPVYKYIIRDDEGGEAMRCFASPKPSPGEDMVFCDCRPVRVEGGVGLEIKTDRILASLPSVAAVHAGGGPAGKIDQLGEKRYFALFSMDRIISGVNIFRVSGMDYRGYSFERYEASVILLFRSGGEAELNISDSLLVAMRSPAVKDTAPCLIGQVSTGGSGVEGKIPVSEPFQADFSEDLFLRPITLTGEFEEKTGLYRFDPSDSLWSCVGVPGKEGGEVEIGGEGIYCFFRDPFPPRIGVVKIQEEPEGSGYYNSFAYYLPIEDSGSGIDPYSPAVFWNGERVVSHWDEIRGNLYVPVPAATVRGDVRLRVEISDRSGNRAVEEFGFVLK